MKKWIILISSFLIVIVVVGFVVKRSSGVKPFGNFLKKSESQNVCLTNELYSEVTDPNAPILSIPFDINDYSVKHWGMVPFCAELRGGNIHGGLDFELKPNAKVFSSTDGVVEKAYVGKEEGSGEIIAVEGDGFSVGYSGLTNLQVKVGDKVKRGDYIANAVRIPHGEHHVHLGITINGKEVCPIKYMDEEFLTAFKEMFAFVGLFAFASYSYASSHKVDAFVCPVFTQDAVGDNNPNAQLNLGDGETSFVPGNAADLTVPETATNDDGDGEPFGDHLSPGEPGYTAIWAN